MDHEEAERIVEACPTLQQGIKPAGTVLCDTVTGPEGLCS
jgi:hypothetical protein